MSSTVEEQKGLPMVKGLQCVLDSNIQLDSDSESDKAEVAWSK